MDMFSPIALGDLTLPNRIVMAPMTRRRSENDGVPGPLVAEYYAQRASAGLIVTEGVFPVQEGKAYERQPGIETDAQVEGWKVVTETVHAAGGRIVLQLMHGGRVSHTDITGTGRITAPSAIAIDGEVQVLGGEKKPFPVPHALTLDEIGETLVQLAASARNAIRAGFDGVEVHGANGYLIHQFLSPVSNVRDDAYGGSPEKRARFAIEAVTAVAEAIGAGRTGIRLSPGHNIQDVLEKDAEDVAATYAAVIEGIRPLGLAYLSVLHRDMGSELVRDLRAGFGGGLVGNSGFARGTTRDGAIALIDDGLADAVAVGRPLIANPDLVARWKNDAPQTEADPSTFYTSGPEGYTDYPTLGED